MNPDLIRSGLEPNCNRYSVNDAVIAPDSSKDDSVIVGVEANFPCKANQVRIQGIK